MSMRAFRLALGMGLASLLAWPAAARDRSRGGTFQGNHGSGTWASNTSRERGQMNRSTTVQSERGTAQRNVQRNWDRSAGKGTYSSETTGPGGKSVVRQGTVEKTGEGSYHQTGTITGPQGHTTDVDRTSTRNDDGSRHVNTTYTNDKGEIKTVDKTITKTEDGRAMTGSYQTSTGQSGTIESKTVVQDGKITTTGSRTNQDGKTWNRTAETSKTEVGLHRDITVTNPEGKTRDRSINIDVTTKTVTP